MAAVSPARRLRRIRIVLAVALLAGLSAMDHAGWLLAGPSGEFSRLDDAAGVVIGVLDPATLELDMADAPRGRKTTIVRLWGVRAGDVESSVEAAQYLGALALHQTVRLRVEPARLRDDDGSVLAHLRRDDGLDLNEAMLASGMAAIDVRRPHPLMGRYAQLATAAKRRR
jgi:endonuclease YncB( thermonuclease family)